jgi:uncharacterized protein
MTRFEWDPKKAAANELYHNVSFDEASEVFDDPAAVMVPDELHSWTEERFHLIGYSSRQLLLVVFVERREEVIRIISARPVTRRERKTYEEGE